jgi:hypothetical protein
MSGDDLGNGLSSFVQNVEHNSALLRPSTLPFYSAG